MFKIVNNLLKNKEVTHDELLPLFKDHYDKEKEFVRASIYWMVNSSEIDDLVQETFFKAWKYFSKFQKKSSFRTWIYRIAQNVTYDHLKKNRDNKSVELEEGLIEVESTDLDLKDLIAKGLMSLNIEQREAFSLHYQIGLTYVEIASLLGIATGTVKSRASKGKEKFIYFLKENGVTHE